MKFLSKGIKATWTDGSIPKKAKTLFFEKWRNYFSTITTSRFTDLVNQDAEPTPLEEKFILESVKETWDYYNNGKDFWAEVSMYEQQDKPIVKRTELIAKKIELVPYKSRKLTEQDF